MEWRDADDRPAPVEADAPSAPRAPGALRFALAGAGVLAVGFAIQVAVFGHGGTSSLSDLPHVFLHRGVGPGHLPYVDRVVEYPVGAGLLLYAATLIRPTPFGVLAATASAAAVLAVGTGLALRRVAGGRAWRWMAGPPLVLYAFQNWDVFAVAALVGGLLAFRRGRYTVAGAGLGVGAAVKLFPGVVVPVLVAERLHRGDRRGAFRLGASAAAVVAVVNLPFVVADARGWWWPAAFQGHRLATWGSVWPYLHRWVALPVAGAGRANAASMLVLLVGIAALSVATARGKVDALGAAAVAVVLFVLANKVYSPTYDLWLVPFFVLLPVRRSQWTAFWAVDLAVYLLVFGFFHHQVPRATVELVLPALVVVRVVVLLALARVAWRHGGSRRSPTAEVRVRTRRRPSLPVGVT